MEKRRGLLRQAFLERLWSTLFKTVEDTAVYVIKNTQKTSGVIALEAQL